MPGFNSQSYTSERKELFVIKWRVRYYLHSSWGRRRNMEKFDPMGTTSKSRFRRYIQGQDALFGVNWKRIVDK